RHVALIGRRVESDRAHRVVHPFPTRRSSDLPRRRHLQRRGQVRPQLKPVHAPGGIALGHLLVDDPAARGHPLDVARGNRSAIPQDRKSTRLNSSHLVISYAVFCLKKKKKTPNATITTYKITNDDLPALNNKLIQTKQPILNRCISIGVQRSIYTFMTSSLLHTSHMTTNT